MHAAICNLSSQKRLILTGTPVENRLEDLWSLMNFVQPGLLGTLDYFCREFCGTILKGTDRNADEQEKLAAKKMTKEIHRRL